MIGCTGWSPATLQDFAYVTLIWIAVALIVGPILYHAEKWENRKAEERRIEEESQKKKPEVIHLKNELLLTQQAKKRKGAQ